MFAMLNAVDDDGRVRSGAQLAPPSGSNTDKNKAKKAKKKAKKAAEASSMPVNGVVAPESAPEEPPVNSKDTAEDLAWAKYRNDMNKAMKQSQNVAVEDDGFETAGKKNNKKKGGAGGGAGGPPLPPPSATASVADAPAMVAPHLAKKQTGGKSASSDPMVSEEDARLAQELEASLAFAFSAPPASAAAPPPPPPPAAAAPPPPPATTHTAPAAAPPAASAAPAAGSMEARYQEKLAELGSLPSTLLLRMLVDEEMKREEAEAKVAAAEAGGAPLSPDGGAHDSQLWEALTEIGRLQQEIRSYQEHIRGLNAQMRK